MSGEYLKTTNTAEIPETCVEVSGFPGIENFVNDDVMQSNQETVLNVLNKPENESLKQWLENFLSKNENVLKINVLKSKLSKATDEFTIKSLIAGVVEGWYKTWEEKNVWEDVWMWEWDLENNLYQAENDEATAAQNTIDMDIMQESKDISAVMFESLAKREDLLQGHDDVRKKTEEKAQLAQQQLPEETRNQLKAEGYDDKFINDYILLRVTLNEVKWSPDFDKNQVAQFESSVNELSTMDIILKNLDNACNIPDTKLSSFNEKNIAQTRTELFNKDVWNESLKTARDSNMKSHEEDYNKMFPEEIWEEELISNYWNFLQWELREFFENYVNNTWGLKDKIEEIKKNDNPTEEDKQLLYLYDYMIVELDKKRKETDEQTKQLIEELCIISQIKWMYMCMWESADFDLNKANEIKSENWILTLNGHIDWVDFAIRQDTNNPEARLQTSTKLAKEWESTDNTDKKENFTIWWENKFVDSNFILPTQEQIFTIITETIKSDKSLVNFDNQSNYLDNLQSTIMSNIDHEYDGTKYAHDYMQEQVKWEKIIDKTISFVEKMKGSKPDSIVSNSNTQLYDFINLMDFNIKYSTSVEKDKLNRVMDKINRMADLAQDNSSDSELENHKDKFAKYLTGDTLLQTRNILNGSSIDGSTQYAFDLFKNYENQSDSRNKGEMHMINFDQMLIDLDRVETQQAEDQDNIKNTEELQALEDEMDAIYWEDENSENVENGNFENVENDKNDEDPIYTAEISNEGW